ncbi:PREDICTED: protein RALF-like 19 [Tarenaya hassleriana]|uniref:protein RALF-like 19 n=1 Tax=Tarenaya hassleriana TaxID=28532 RepID=UPI00053C5822|nr:PREDICTED: protein RALF-like 19 [Tarenaya hassleriana]
MGLKLLLILGFLTLAMVAESANATWPLTKSCVSGQGCIGDEDDLESLMDSETNRRQLAQGRRYISYGALKKNNVPCNRRGRSYYDCTRRKRANPYRRGCSVITHCGRFTS